MHEIIKLILILPIGSVSCERYFQQCDFLKTGIGQLWEKQINWSCLLMVHRDMDVSRENILKRFYATGNRHF